MTPIRLPPCVTWFNQPPNPDADEIEEKHRRREDGLERTMGASRKVLMRSTKK
jgi:hypothetical protein